MKICASAPAKIIWFGEHFVVLGKPAIASSINLKARVCISDSVNDKIIIESKDLGVKYIYGKDIPKELIQFRQIIDYCLSKNIVTKLKPFHAVIKSSIPISSGLGSSASTAVAFTAAFLAYHNIGFNRELISRVAYEAEKIVHAKPSGIDNTIASYGGFLVYQKGRIRRIRVRWPRKYLLLIVDTGVPRNTGKVVKMVLERYQRNEDIMKYIYTAAEKIVRKAMKCLRNGNIECIAELMNINHGLLASLGISIYEIESIVHRSIMSGALAAKITGAGMGGSVIILTDRTKLNHVIRAISPLAHRIIPVSPVSQGVTLEELRK